MKIVNLKIDQIKPYEKNPRHNAEAVPHVARSIKEFGFQQPLVLDENHVIIVGHTRLLAAKSLGLKEVPCTVAKMTPEKAKAYRLMDNRTHERATWDNVLLMDEILDLKEFYTPEFLDFTSLFENVDESSPDKDDDGNDSKYTDKIESPVYKITGERPSLADLCDSQKQQSLLESIQKSNIPVEIKNFLTIASYRHIKFNYQNIAEYYAHADKETQDLMEKSALIIIDYNKSIEYGYQKLCKDLADSYAAEGHTEEDDV
jgi:hypothetical protein